MQDLGTIASPSRHRRGLGRLSFSQDYTKSCCDGELYRTLVISLRADSYQTIYGFCTTRDCPASRSIFGLTFLRAMQSLDTAVRGFCISLGSAAFPRSL